MKRLQVVLLVIAFLGMALSAPAQANKTGEKIVLPDAVAKTIKENCPQAEIGKLELEKEAGINLYDIEFKAGKGEIEVAEDGTVMDIATVIQMKDVPPAAAAALQKAASDNKAKIAQIEKSEIRAEIQKQAGKVVIVKMAAVKLVYEAELIKGKQKGELQVAADGKIVESLKWMKKREKDEESEETEEKEEADVNHTILPKAVLTAFKTAYPVAVIKGTSKEMEKGLVRYELESVDGKINRDIVYASDGSALEIEESGDIGPIPAAVKQAIAEKYPQGKLLKIEKMTRDQEVSYEALIRVGKTKIEMEFSPDGKEMSKNR
jgi:hypothetical protein